MGGLIQKYQDWRFKNTLLLIVSLVVLFVFADRPEVKNAISQVGNFGYPGIFITGLFFVSTFTVAPATVVLYLLSGRFNPLAIALVAGFGSATGDLLILNFLRDRVFAELQPLFAKIAGKRLRRLFKTPYFAWLSPVIGVLIIASPFPDEIGIGLLGVSKLKRWQFFLISLACNAAGIFIVVSVIKSL